MKTLKRINLGAATFALMLAVALPLPVAAVDYDLTATAGTVTMPDGAVVPVWGLVDAGMPGTTPFAPVPVLTATAGDNLTITLTNQLTEPVSLVINGQPLLDPFAPVFFPDLNGRQRVRSFMHEALPRATPIAAPVPVAYNWGPLKPGTYLISSGSHPSVQVPMGLYAVLNVDEVEGAEIYPGETFDSEATLLFSEIDPLLNQAVTDGVYGDPLGPYPTALKVGYKPKYFLINGQPWSAVTPPLATVAAGDTVLLRMLNAGLRARMPIFPGQALTMIAEDGNPGNYQPTQYTADLVAGKTIDALMTVSAEATDTYLPLHDRMLGLSGGGMLGYLAVGSAAVSLDVVVAGPGTVSATSLPGGIATCTVAGGPNCTSSYLTDTAVTLHAVPTGTDSALASWSVNLTVGGTPTGECTGGGDCVVSLDQHKTVTAIFANYTATTLVSPNGGEQVPFDATLPIRWAAPAGVYTFDLGYSPSPGAPFRLIASRVGGHEFQWNVAAANLRPSAAVRLAIVGYDAAGNVVSRDTTDAPFALISPLQLTYPNGAVSETAIVAGGSVTITWNVRPTVVPITRASLWYQPTTTAAWTLIADVDATLGSYAWTAPTTPTVGATARIAMTLYDAAGKVFANDASDAPFSISDPTPVPLAVASPRVLTAVTTVTNVNAAPVAGVLLLIPNGGEILAGEIPYTVLWQDNTEATTFALDYSLDGGQNWQSLATGLEGNQFDWIIAPELRGSKSMQLRVTAYDGQEQVLARDLSDEAFAID